MRMTYASNLYDYWTAYLRAEARGDGPQWKNADPERARIINDILREMVERDSG